MKVTFVLLANNDLENYAKKVFNELKGDNYNFESVFNQLGLFFYEDFKPGAYFCYKKAYFI